MAVVALAKGNRSVVVGKEAVVGNGNAVSVTAVLAEDLLGASVS